MPLTLVGSVHGDERGFERTLGYLRSFQPDLVLVELSPYGKVFRSRHQCALQRTLNHNLALAARHAGLTFRRALHHPEIKAIRRQLALPFEYRAARRFSQETGSRMSLVDYSPFSRKMIEPWQELLAAHNLASLLVLPEDSRLSPAQIYDLAARNIRKAHPWLGSLAGNASADADPLWEKRERFMAARIRSALKRFAPRKAVYLGGWQHLITGGAFPSLRELFEIELTRCYLLDQGFL